MPTPRPARAPPADHLLLVADQDEAERIIEGSATLTPLETEAPAIAAINAKVKPKRQAAIDVVPQPPDPNAGKGLHLYTYAEVRDRLENAKTDDDRALAVDMIRSVADEAQRAELTELAKLLADAPG